jgi:LysR family positive regulator for ilvC
MEFRDLSLFLNLAAHLHFGRAAARSHLSPSALSRAIRRMEEELGTPLFLRDRRSVRLTEAGERFRQFARETLENWNGFRRGLAPQGEVRGELALYCSVTASHMILPPLISRFGELHPGVRISLQTGAAETAVERILDDEIDLAVAARPERLPAALAFRAISTTPLLFIAPTADCEVSRLAGRHPIKWEEVPLVLPESGVARNRIDAWFRRRHVRPPIHARVDGNEAIMSLVSLGFGVGVVPELVLRNCPPTIEVRPLDVRPALPPYSIGLCARKRRLAHPPVAAFFELAGEE